MAGPFPLSPLARRAFASKRVLLTGASSGIGEQLALGLASCGARLVLVARRKPLLLSLQKRLSAAGARAWVLPADLVKADAETLVRKAEALGGPIDVLVSCAAFFDLARLEDIAPKRLEDTVRLNATFPMLATRALVPRMKKRGSGQFIHIASLVGLQPMPYYQVYAATKHALTAFCKSLDIELAGTGIRTTVIFPTGVRTPMVAHLEELSRKSGMSFLEPAEVARRTLEAAARGRLLVPLGILERLLIQAGRTFPFLERPAMRLIKRNIDTHHFNRTAPAERA
ncbi:MAG: SDR family NAD(P)-dependent oxidoreductase [Spirochaetes bacterium]|nr:SDR family NAD(P)-dependent oxidoreductase [Spirochaetota bacterium]